MPGHLLEEKRYRATISNRSGLAPETFTPFTYTVGPKNTGEPLKEAHTKKPFNFKSHFTN